MDLNSSNSPIVLSHRFDEAMRLALKLHRHDTRKGKRTPYVSHLLGVCSLVLQDGGTEEEAIAALLHDALEDHPEEISAEDLEKQFGEEVLAIVRSCTDTPPDYRGGAKPPWRDRKLAYLDHLPHATASARRVTLADKLYNAREILHDVHTDGESTWARFNAGRDDQIWYYRAVFDLMRQAGQRGLLMDQFARVIEELGRTAVTSAKSGNSKG